MSQKFKNWKEMKDQSDTVTNSLIESLLQTDLKELRQPDPTKEDVIVETGENPLPPTSPPQPEPTSPGPENAGEKDIPLPRFGVRVALVQEAAVWVFIAAFIGLAIAWSSGLLAPWAGALIGGGTAFLLGVFVLAALDESVPSRGEKRSGKHGPAMPPS